PRDSMGKLTLQWVERGMVEDITKEKTTLTNKRDKKKKEPKGPYSYGWSSLYRSGFFTLPAVVNVLSNHSREGDKDKIKDALHRAFKVATMSIVSLEDFRCWLYKQIKLTDLDMNQRKAIANHLNNAKTDMEHRLKVKEQEDGI